MFDRGRFGVIPDGTENGDYYFDARAADHAQGFFELRLVHTKGEWAGQPFVLEPWERDEVIRPLFGWKRKADGLRRYRLVYVEVPKKNGKSTLGAGIALYLLFADGEFGAEVYSAAGDRGQAGIVFEQAKQMVAMSPKLAGACKVLRSAIWVEDTKSVYRVLSADAPLKHGYNASGIVFDELHVQRTRELWDVLRGSVAARQQPVTIAFTTAGFDRESICWEQHERARRVRDGIVDDPTVLPVMYGAEMDADWLDEEVWKDANPNYGVTVKPDFLASEAMDAKRSPAYQNTFRRLHLNQWTQQRSRWLPMIDWDACGEPVLEGLLKGAPCYGGLDLSSTSDIASFVLTFPAEEGEEEQFAWLPRFWVPQERMVERSLDDGVPYDAWVRDGLMIATPGNVIDYAYIVREIERMAEAYNIIEIAFDRWGAFQVAQQLEATGLTMVGFGQGFKSMKGPTTELLRIVLDRKLRHGGNKVLRWMADNMIVDTNAAGDHKPNKSNRKQKIDGIVAGLMGLDRAVRHGFWEPSVYEERGLEVV